MASFSGRSLTTCFARCVWERLNPCLLSRLVPTKEPTSNRTRIPLHTLPLLQVEHGPEIPIEVQASVELPTVEIITTSLDYGLVRLKVRRCLASTPQHLVDALRNRCHPGCHNSPHAGYLELAHHAPEHIRDRRRRLVIVRGDPQHR